MNRLDRILVDGVVIPVVDEENAALAVVVGHRRGDDLGAEPIPEPTGPKGEGSIVQ